MKLKLSDIYDLQMGKTPARNTPSFWDGVNAWVSISDMSTDEKYIGTTREGITDEAIKKTGIKIVPKGTLLMSFKLSVGKVAITAENVYTNEAIMAFIDKGNHDVDIDFMYHLFQSIDWTVGTNKAVKGLTLNKATLSEKIIELPPLDVQREIASTLDDVDEAKRILNSMLARNDDVVKSRFIEMFGDPVTNPMGWEEHRLDEYIRFLTSGSRGWSKYFSDTGEIFITIKNVKNNRISLDNVQYVTPPDNAEAQRTKVREGDLLISITADLGRTGVVSKEIEERGAYINQHLTCIRLKQDRINPGYVSYFMESDAGKRQFEAKNQAAVKAGLNFDAIKSLKLLVPPLELQNEFMSFVELADKSEYFNLLEHHKLLRLHVLERISSST